MNIKLNHETRDTIKISEKEQKEQIEQYPNLRLSVSESAKLFGIDQITIRRALKAKELRYIVVRNRYKIPFQSLLKWSQTRKTLRNKLANKGIGQYVDKWRIKNTLYSPRPK